MSGVQDDMDGIAPADIAARWHARLMAPDCTLRERERFESWLGQSPENLLAFEDIKSLWAGLDGLDEDEALAPHVATALERDDDSFMRQWTAATESGRRSPSRTRSRLWLRLGAGVAATVVVGLLLYVMRAREVVSVPYAASDRIESVQLSDGSSVRLDLETAIAVKLDDERRDVALRQGRAMFDVAKDARRPFVVDAGVGTITALGTRFEVRRNGELVSVTLLEGAVGIATTSERSDPRLLRLAPGQRARYTPETRSWAVDAADVDALTSWSQGFHVFGATPLRQAVAEINRYSDVKLALADPALGDLLVSGSYKLGDGKAISEALPYALPVEVEQRDGDIVISKR